MGALAFAASTATLSLSGTVATNMDISIIPVSVATLDFTVGATDLLVTTVKEISNGPYHVTLASGNLAGVGIVPYFKGTVPNVDQVPYTLKYQGTTVTFTAGVATITTAATPKTPQLGTSKQLTISFAASWINPDTYSESLLFTIIATSN